MRTPSDASHDGDEAQQQVGNHRFSEPLAPESPDQPRTPRTARGAEAQPNTREERKSNKKNEPRNKSKSQEHQSTHIFDSKFISMSLIIFIMTYVDSHEKLAIYKGGENYVETNLLKMGYLKNRNDSTTILSTKISKMSYLKDRNGSLTISSTNLLKMGYLKDRNGSPTIMSKYIGENYDEKMSYLKNKNGSLTNLGIKLGTCWEITKIATPKTAVFIANAITITNIAPNETAVFIAKTIRAIRNQAAKNLRYLLGRHRQELAPGSNVRRRGHQTQRCATPTRSTARSLSHLQVPHREAARGDQEEAERLNGFNVDEARRSFLEVRFFR